MKSLPNNHSSDKDLLQQYMQGNQSAFELIFNRHRDRVYSSILLKVKEIADADDIFQDVFIKAIDCIQSGKYNEEGKFLPWLLRIAHNCCMDYFRGQKRFLPISESHEEDEHTFVLADDGLTDERIIRNQTCERVRKLIDSLPEDLRDVLILRHYGELSFKEIAAITNTSVNTALGRMRYALLNLRSKAGQLNAA